MASKARKRHMARQFMAAKSMTQHVPNQGFTLKIQKNKEDLVMTKFLQRMLTASVRVLNEKADAKSTDSVRLFAAELRRLEIASEILEHFDGPDGREPVDAARLELSMSEAGLEYAARDAAAVRPEILQEGEKLPSAKLSYAIAIARAAAWARAHAGKIDVPAEPADTAD